MFDFRVLVDEHDKAQALSLPQDELALRQRAASAYGQSTGALHLLTDSTGIKAEGEGALFARKH